MIDTPFLYNHHQTTKACDELTIACQASADTQYTMVVIEILKAQKANMSEWESQLVFFKSVNNTQQRHSHLAF